MDRLHARVLWQLVLVVAGGAICGISPVADAGSSSSSVEVRIIVPERHAASGEQEPGVQQHTTLIRNGERITVVRTKIVGL